MDITAPKPVSSVAASPTGERGRSASAPTSGGKDLPRDLVTPPPAHIDPVDPVVKQDQQDRSAALARRMNDFLRSISRDLEFQVDVDSGDAVLTVRDSAGNVVRKIPGEEALQMLRRNNVESGTLIDSMV
jgi:flagellar protein FlaG